VQTYKCKKCGHKFQNKRKGSWSKSRLLERYIWQRQTLSDLAFQYKISKRWVQAKLDQETIQSIVKLSKKSIVVVADTTFFSRTSGVTVFREPNLKKNIWWKETNSEKAEIYIFGRKHLEKNGFAIQAVVLDGRKGIREVFKDIPVQMCHFHQKQIVKRYLTSNPKTVASRELKNIVYFLTKTNQKNFTAELKHWFEKHKDFLKQKTTNPQSGRWFYTHKRLRAAYRSLQTNLPYLFTYQKYPELKIPNTTNSMDGYFNILKSLLNVHRGLNLKRRKRLVIEILKGNRPSQPHQKFH